MGLQPNYKRDKQLTHSDE